MSMSFGSRFQLSLGLGVCFATFAGSAQAAIINATFDITDPTVHSVGVNEQDTCQPPQVCPFEDIVRFRVTDHAGNAIGFDPSAIGDTVFVEEGNTIQGCLGGNPGPGVQLSDPLPKLITTGVAGCVSDVIRFVNNPNGFGEIWFASDQADPADLAVMTAQAPFSNILAPTRVETSPPSAAGNLINVIKRLNTTPVSFLGARIASDYPSSLTSQGVSDNIAIYAVPAVSTAGAIGMAALLLAIGIFFLARQRARAA